MSSLSVESASLWRALDLDHVFPRTPPSADQVTSNPLAVLCLEAALPPPAPPILPPGPPCPCEPERMVHLCLAE